MELLLGVLLFSWFCTSALYVPFIRLLYKWKFRRQHQKTVDAFNKRTPIFDKFHESKAGTPVGGGLLIVVFVTIMLPILLLLMRYFWIPITSVYPLFSEIKILLVTFVSFGILGLIDDFKKTFGWKQDKFLGLRMRHKLILEIILATVISYWIAVDLQIDVFHIPFWGVIDLGYWFIPFSVFTIISFTNAFNITDGLDGLASGMLVVALTAFWTISSSILDAPLSIFIALWLGSLLAFLYFNIHPARIFLGDTGALSFGATFAVVGILLGKIPVLVVIGGIFVLEVASSLIQLLSKRFLDKKIFVAAPMHLWLQAKGWPETKIVMRFWVITVVLSILGLWLAQITGAAGY
jgi:phospho-N-acetylmuramoyl-pentapeptide-transferase